MTIWTPELKTREGHPYQQLGAAIIDAINVGDLKPGERLPPQRDLAYALKISVGAVGRAYALARARGLLVGEVGRGTYVAGRNNRPSSDDFSSPGHQDTVVNLRRNLPPDIGQGTVLKELAQYALEDGENLFLDYNPSGGTLLQRSAGAQWLSRFGIVAPPDDVVVCAGVHQAMTIALLTATKPGDLIVCDHLTYMGIKQIAVMHQRRLEGLPMDAHGMIPEALDDICARKNVAAVFLVPTFQNPTASLMPAERRNAIAKIAETKDLFLLEDDVYAALLPAPLPTFQSLVPERVFYASGSSKSLAPGLRTAFLKAPAQFTERAKAIQHNLNLGQAPLIANLTAQFISSGAMEQVLAAQRKEVAKRAAAAKELFSDYVLTCHESAIHAWLTLPESWRAHEFSQAALDHGISLTIAEDYAVGRQPAPQAVRLALGAPKTLGDLRAALLSLKELLEENPLEQTQV